MWNRAAAILALLCGLAHSFIGTFDALYAALSPTAELAARGPVIATWYILGLFFFWSAWSYWRHPAGMRGIDWLFLASGAIFVVIALAEAGPAGLIALPQWALLLPVGLCGLMARRGSTAP